MSTEREQLTQFDYLLNAMLHAGQESKPAEHGYANKRKALYAYVRDLEARAQAAALQAEAPREAPPLDERQLLKEWAEAAGVAINDTWVRPFQEIRTEDLLQLIRAARAALPAPAVPTVSSGPDALQHAREHSSGREAALQACIDALQQRLNEIGDYAHDRSAGPAAWDALWEVRRMAYEGVDLGADFGQQGREQAAEASGSDEQDQGADVKEEKQ